MKGGTLVPLGVREDEKVEVLRPPAEHFLCLPPPPEKLKITEGGVLYLSLVFWFKV